MNKYLVSYKDLKTGKLYFFPALGEENVGMKSFIVWRDLALDDFKYRFPDREITWEDLIITGYKKEDI